MIKICKHIIDYICHLLIGCWFNMNRNRTIFSGYFILEETIHSLKCSVTHGDVKLFYRINFVWLTLLSLWSSVTSGFFTQRVNNAQSISIISDVTMYHPCRTQMVPMMAPWTLLLGMSCIGFISSAAIMTTECVVWYHDNVSGITELVSPWWRHQMETFSALLALWGIHWSPVNFPHKGQWCRALMYSLICAWINSWVNNGKAGDLRHHCAHYDITVMSTQSVKYNHHLANQYLATWFKTRTHIWWNFINTYDGSEEWWQPVLFKNASIFLSGVQSLPLAINVIQHYLVQICWLYLDNAWVFGVSPKLSWVLILLCRRR